MSGIRIDKVRDGTQIVTFSAMVWESIDVMRELYPEMLQEIDEYVAHHKIRKSLENFRENYCPPSGEAFIGTTDGFPVGICLLRKEDDGGGELNRMYVRPSARGLGMGRMLARAVIEEARAEGLHTLRLGALYRHTEALPLYESLGFVRHFPEGELHAGDGRVVHMKLEL